MLIYTDILDSVTVFNSLAANESLHNSVLMAAAGLVIESGIDLCVKHIEGRLNIHADMLSHLLIEDYKHIFLKTASAHSAHQECCCQHNGETAFSCPGWELDIL